MHTRREFAILASAGALAGCSATTGGGGAASLLIPSPPTPPRRTRLALTPVAVAPERVIRTVTGLRPFRPAGFVVRAEPLG
ncbi:MAG TPA: hypothetical protein VF589_06525, partial [Allosphingosinicella sp.]